MKSARHVSITVFLLVAIGGLVAFATGTVLLVSGYANFKNTRELLIDKANLMMGSLEKDVQSHVFPAENVVNHLGQLSQQGALDVSSKRDAITTLKASLAAASQLTGAVLWQPDGRAVEVWRTGDRPLYIKTVGNATNSKLQSHLKALESSGQTQWNPPFRKDGLSFISVSAPLYFNGKFAGAASAAISLKELSKFVRSISRSQSLHGFILYGNAEVLAHRNLPELSTALVTPEAPLHRLEHLGDPVLDGYEKSPVLNEAAKDGFEVHEVTTKDGRHLVLSRKLTVFGSVPWTLGTYARLDQLTMQLRRLMRSIIAGLALLVLSLIAAVILARRIAAPVKNISAAAEQIGQMKLSTIGQLPTSRITELNNQAKAFNQMLDGLKWFETYVPRRLVNRLMQKQGDDPVVSREEVLTVMFTDIVGYTAMSEKLSPAQTAEFLNEHFELLNQCIEAEDGTIDKYIGDAVMAFWGAPEKQDNHAMRACRAALAIRDAISASDHALRIKIAIHTGPLIVGNIGAKGRMNYTVIGDTVNTCSRIEKLASDLDDGSPVSILLSAQTADEISGTFQLEHAGEFKVKGRKESVQVFRLIG